MNKYRQFSTHNLRFFQFLILFIFLSSCIPLWATEYSQDKLIRLDGKWELYLEKTPEEVFQLADNNVPSDYMTVVPGVWNAEVEDFGLESPNTYGCYRMELTGLGPGEKYALLTQEAPGTSCALYINRVLTAQTGDPFLMLEPDFDEKPNAYNPSHSKSCPLFCEFSTDKDGKIEIVFLVSNYYYRKGGLWESVFFGTPERISRLNTILLLFNSIVMGCLFFMGLLTLIQFFINKKRMEYFYLGIAAIIFALRIGTSDYCALSILFPNLIAEVKIKIEYLAIWLAPVAIIQMIFRIYPSKNRYIFFKWFKERQFRHFIIICDLIMGLLSLVLPAYYSNKLVPYLQIGLIVISIYVVTFIIINLIKRKKYSLYNFLSYFVLCMGGVMDIIYTQQKDILPLSFFPFFLVAFVIIQLLMLAAIQNDIYKETIKTSNELQRLNEAYLRFVPQEFLNLLNKESVIKTKLGDYSNIEMAIMFSKVHIECDDDEDSLDEHFLVFNEYLKQISTIIKNHNGFVSKFLSGGFMALFPVSELDAVVTALEIEACTKRLSGTEIFKNHKVTAYTGIHYGKMIIGTIGEENRLDDTVISDTVNTSARIESVCEKLNKNIIVSQVLEKLLLSSKESLEEQSIHIKLNELEAMYVKGKEKPLQLFEVKEIKEQSL